MIMICPMIEEIGPIYRLDALRQAVGGQGDFFRHDLPIHVNVRAPGEFHLDRRQPDARGAAHGRTPVAPFSPDSKGKVTSVSTSSGAKPGASVMIVTRGRSKSGKMSMGKLIQRVSAVDQKPQRRRNRKQPVTQRKSNNGIEHDNFFLPLFCQP